MVYFAKLVSSGFIKIGYSANVKERMKFLLGAHGPIDLLAVLYGSLKTERAHHECFASLRINGEWFAPGKELTDYIASIVSCEPVGPVRSVGDDKPRRRAVGARQAVTPYAQKSAPPRAPSGRLELVAVSSAPSWRRSWNV